MSKPEPRDIVGEVIPQRLKANIIGPWGLAALAIGITSPAMGLYALWGPMQVAAGPITPLVFVGALLLTLPTALSYVALNRYAPSTGATSNWLWVSVSPSIGHLAGLCMATYFTMAAIAQPLIFSLFFRDLLDWLHIHIGDQIALIAGVLVATLPAAFVTVTGAEASIKTTLRLMIAETIVVVALSATIVIQKARVPGGLSFLPLDPHQATHGVNGFWAAMILGVLAFAGYDVVSTAAEEAHAPREYIPKAILLTVVGIAFFWAVNAWAFTLGVSPENVVQYTTHGLTAVTPIASTYWGAGSLIVIGTAFTGITAVYISCVQGASRIVFALARHRLLPKSLARLTPNGQIPRNSVIGVLTCVVVIDVLSIFIFRNGLDSFTWWANALVFFATLTFIGVNVANIFYFRRVPHHQVHLGENLLVPIVGVLMNAYLLYAAFFSSLWSQDFRTGKSVVAGSCVLLGLQILAVIYVRLKRRELLSQGPPLNAAEALSENDETLSGEPI